MFILTWPSGTLINNKLNWLTLPPVVWDVGDDFRLVLLAVALMAGGTVGCVSTPEVIKSEFPAFETKSSAFTSVRLTRYLICP